MNSVTVGGPGLVAVGPGAWTSPDGITWSRVPPDFGVFGYVNLNAVIAGGPGLVAVGWGKNPGSGSGAGMVFTSPDGVTWSRIPHDEAVFGGQEVGFGSESFQSMNSVTAEGPGLVAVGFDRSVGPDDFFDAAVWTATTED